MFNVFIFDYILYIYLKMNLFCFLIFTILLVIESLVISQSVLDGFLDSECGKVEFKLLSFFYYFKYSIKFLLHKKGTNSPTSRIYGGVEAKLGDWGWHVNFNELQIYFI